VSEPEIFACGFSWRKRRILRRFLGGVRVRSVSGGRRIPANGQLFLWGSRPAPEPLAEGVQVVRVEDGFLRSVGLGADLVQPLSWVMDGRGMYYDSRQPSDLEDLLQTSRFDGAVLARAARLRHRIVEEGLSKYNIGQGHWSRPAGGARVILVPGQVESDASIRFGAPAIRSNIGLLRAVREANPDAYVIYKPHPDVFAGLRSQGTGEGEAVNWCDEVIGDVAMAGLLAEVDEVHVLTSLTGFEGLLRGKAVTCYGQPFYAGWGLTQDKVPIPRRSRMLDLDALVAGVLILYPRYTSRSTARQVSPEEALDELVAWRKRSPSGELPAWRRLIRIFLRNAT